MPNLASGPTPRPGAASGPMTRPGAASILKTEDNTCSPIYAAVCPPSTLMFSHQQITKAMGWCSFFPELLQTDKVLLLSS